MLCTPTICQVAITRTLVDGGAGLSVPSVEAFNLLRIPLERLQPSRPFSHLRARAPLLVPLHVAIPAPLVSAYPGRRPRPA